LVLYLPLLQWAASGEAHPSLYFSLLSEFSSSSWFFTCLSLVLYLPLLQGSC
jgi:hypothetical protein